METPGELSRSFKRRQRRKKQQERRRQADGAEDGTVDGHERTVTSPVSNPVTSPITSPVTSPVTSPEQPAASGSGGSGRTSEHAEKAVRGERTHSERTVSGGSDSHPRHKAARRGKRSSAAPSSAPPCGQSTEPEPATPAVTDQRTEPPEPPEPPPGPVERVSPPPPPVSTPEQRPAPHRESSPVVSCTEEVLHSVRALRTVLTELRTRLLAPPPAPPAKSAQSTQPVQTAPPAKSAQTVKSSKSSSPTQSTQSAKSAQPSQPNPQSAGVAADAAMSPPADTHPAGEPEKTKEQIKAERKAKAEAAKLAKAAKALQKKQAATAEGGGDGGDKGGDKASAKPAKSGGASTTEAAAKPKPTKPTAAEALSKAIEKVSISAEETSVQQPAADKPVGEKSKAELKAERRAKQEAQRAAKAAAATAAKGPKGPGKPGKAAADHKTPAKAEQHEESASKSERRSAKKTVEKAAAKKGLQMFSHLLPFDASNVDALITKNGVHPSLVPLLLRRSAGQLSGANAGAAALLAALADFVDSYMTPDQRELRRDLPERLARELSHLERCRPLSVAMQNVAQRLEQFIRHELPADKSDYEAKLLIIDWMKDFISDHICKAMDAITQFATEKIVDGDVILTYGRSSAVLDVLCHAHKKGRRFQVIVIDSRPRLEGRDMLRQLLTAGVPCSYGVITAISHHMKEATKVLLGAQALLSNGVLLSRAGTALVSLTGRALNRPVLVCCETYKFSDRLQTDSQVYNELGDPDELMTSPDSPLAGWRQSETLSLLNLEYDVTPPELVDVVITELGAIPCTSVPAVLRLQQLTSAY